MRRTPFRLREKVDKKLDELLAYGIIEPVMNGPTRWVSPLVVAPKPYGDVCVCVDLRRANEAIVRERHPMKICCISTAVSCSVNWLKMDFPSSHVR